MAAAGEMRATPKRIVKDFLWHVLAAFAPKRKEFATILMYHSIGDASEFFTTTAYAFEQQLQTLKERSWKVVKLSELVERLTNNESIKGLAALTFDDGYEDNYSIAFPLLQKYNYPASIFLTTNKLRPPEVITEKTPGTKLSFLTKEQVKEMRESALIEFLPHGETHAKLHNLSKQGARKEVLDSLQHITELVGETPRIFAYPSGRYTAETLSLLTDEHFTAAVTVIPGLVREGAAMLELPRNHVDSATTPAEFNARLTVAGEWYEKLKKVR